MSGADDLSFELARAMLVAASPEEVPVLDALGVDFVEASSRPSTGDGALGFDVGHLAMAVAASSVAVAAKDYLLEVAKKYAVDGGSSAIKALTKFLRGRRRSTDDGNTEADSESGVADQTALRLDPEEVTEVRRRAYQHACGLGLSDAKASLLADALAGSLALE